MELVRYDALPDRFRDFNDYRGYMEFKSRKSKNALKQIEEESRITIRWASKQQVRVSPIPVNLLLLATEHYGDLPDHVGLVAYVRHHYTNYEYLLSECENCFGREEAYQLLKEKVTRTVCKRLGIEFSVEYLFNSKMPWLVKKDFGSMMEMYR